MIITVLVRIDVDLTTCLSICFLIETPRNTAVIEEVDQHITNCTYVVDQALRLISYEMMTYLEKLL